MKTITLRTLVREPRKVKRWTRAGQSVQVTDRGRPLWTIQPAAVAAENPAARARAIDELLDEVVAESAGAAAGPSAAELLEATRR